MYVCGLVIPVPEDRMEAYRQWAQNGARIFKAYGCLEAAEAKMHADGVLNDAGQPPFDARRLILGCFEPIAVMGRKT
jgi:uncharacterized protein YbaA (DUF1428 family)